MVVCARERYAYSDISDSVRYLETVLVPKVSVTYLDTMCTSYKASERDPRIRQAYFIGEPTRHIDEACAKILSELIDRISIVRAHPYQPPSTPPSLELPLTTHLSPQGLIRHLVTVATAWPDGWCCCESGLDRCCGDGIG
jgi:hypothetical protein